MQPAGRTGAGDEWATPWDVFNAIDRVYGPFDLDAAANTENALCPTWYTPEDDGLAQPWKGRVWGNPPYSQTGRWTAKAATEVQKGNADVVVMLVPARTGCQWWRTALAAGARVVYWPRRISFGGGGRAAFDNALLVFGHAVTARAACCNACGQVFISQRPATTCSGRCRQKLYRAKTTRKVK